MSLYLFDKLIVAVSEGDDKNHLFTTDERIKLVKNSLIQNFLALITALYIYFIRMTSNIKYENMHVPEFYWKNNKPKAGN